MLTLWSVKILVHISNIIPCMMCCVYIRGVHMFVLDCDILPYAQRLLYKFNFMSYSLN